MYISHFNSGVMRILARRMLQCAVQDERLRNRIWSASVVRQLDSIDGDAKALIWSIGIAWTVRAERVIGSIRPPTSFLLLFPALYCAAHFLMARLVWYGVPPSTQGMPNDARGLLRLALCIGLLGLVGCVAPGRVRRRVFVAAAFPLLALTGLFGAAWVTDLVTAAGLASPHEITATMMRGVGFGAAMSALLSLPALLLYRKVAAPIVLLSLVPAFARSNWTAQVQFHHAMSLLDLLWLACPFIFAAIGMVVTISICRRWQQCQVLPSVRPPYLES
jgi:hypothetical protein